MKNKILLPQIVPFSIRYLVLLLPLLMGCSTQKFIVHSVVGILEKGLTALYEENDLGFAEQAIAANLKLVEALLKNDPDNEKLLLIVAEAYTSYALGFVEDDSPQRASQFYLRAREYGLAILKKNKKFCEALDKDFNRFQTALAAFGPNDVPALFWTANAWGSYINLNKTNVTALGDFPRVQAMMECVSKLDEAFYFGGAHLFLGTILASRPPMLGGNPQKARDHFEACLKINEQKFLLAKYFYARYYAVQTQDRQLFQQLLQDILTAPDDLLPEQRLANEIARKKAQKLSEQEEDLFL